MKFIFYIFLSLIVSCGKGQNKTHPIQASALSKFVNAKNIPNDPNLTLDKAIINNNYPIEIALYSDQKFYYNLPNLGDGKGTWEYRDGKIELKAKRSLFDMYIDVVSTDENSSSLTIEFTDRFGPNSMRMENINI